MSRHDKVSRGRAPGPQPASNMDRGLEAIRELRLPDMLSFDRAINEEVTSSCGLPSTVIVNAGRANEAALRADLLDMEARLGRARIAVDRALSRVSPGSVVMCHPDNLALLTRAMPLDEARLLGLPAHMHGMMIAADPNMPRTRTERRWVPPDWGPMWALGPEDEYLAGAGFGTYAEREVPVFIVLDRQAMMERFRVAP